MYKIVRHYSGNSRRRTIATGLTLEKAQEHCSDPETSSRTATGTNARRISRNHPGEAWFDGYEET